MRAAECVLPRARRAGVDCSNPEPLLIDRFEVTRREWREWLDEHPEEVWDRVRAFAGRWEPGGDSWPASWMTQIEAMAFADGQGMRLPSAREWMRVAAGTRAQRLPWGAPARSVSNSLELGLVRPAPVGTFENGRTSLGVHDLVGNVSEWVQGTLLELDSPLASGRSWAAGGSYLDRTRELFVPDKNEPGGARYNARLLEPEHRGRDIGMRLCAYAEDYLRSQAPNWGDDARSRARLRAVGRKWGPAAVPLLERLAGEQGASSPLAELLAGARR